MSGTKSRAGEGHPPAETLISRAPAIAVSLGGASAFAPTWQVQRRLAELRYRLEIPDTLLLLEHAPVITLGRHARADHVLAAGEIPVVPIDRGGDVTYHGPGQLTAYWIADLQAHDSSVRAFIHELEESVILALARFGIAGSRRTGLTGVWVRAGGEHESAASAGRAQPERNGREESGGWSKIAAIGVRVSRWVSLHGIALNVGRAALPGFARIVPCGLPGERVTAMEALLSPPAAPPAPPALHGALIEAFAERFAVRFRHLEHEALTTGEEGERLLQRLLAESRRGERKPGWLRTRLPGGARYTRVRQALGEGRLHTVCESARCPNCHECWNAGTATFMILGERCTRACRFCAIGQGTRPAPPDPEEPQRVARAAARLGLRHVVVTSVTRDDLSDGGAGLFAATVRAIRASLPGATVEVLIPDFGGSPDALATVLAARPEVLNHNVETVARLYPRVRPGADYGRSLRILEAAARAGLAAKSGFMVGLGESPREIRTLLGELYAAGCRRVTLGQYLRPGPRNLPVHRYYAPEDFAAFAAEARERGFAHVQSGPLVRSSYQAALA